MENSWNTLTPRQQVASVFVVGFLGYAVMFAPNVNLKVFDVAHRAVESQLHSPSSVKYLKETYTEGGNNDYLVGGQIEAQNAFGVRLRQYYFVRVHRDNGQLEAGGVIFKQ